MAAAHPKVVSFRRDSSTNPRARLSLNLMNEQSPLLKPRRSQDGLPKVPSPLDDDEWDAEGGEESVSSWYLLLLTISGLG